MHFNLNQNNVLICWGGNLSFQLNVPVINVPFVFVSTRFAHNCALDNTSLLYCWGNNDYGQSILPVDNE